MAKSKLVKANQKIADSVAGGYKKIERGVVGGYKKIENGAVDGFTKISDSFVDRFLTKPLRKQKRDWKQSRKRSKENGKDGGIEIIRIGTGQNTIGDVVKPHFTTSPIINIAQLLYTAVSPYPPSQDTGR